MYRKGYLIQIWGVRGSFKWIFKDKQDLVKEVIFRGKNLRENVEMRNSMVYLRNYKQNDMKGEWQVMELEIKVRI